MSSQASRVGLRVAAAILICLVAFYVGRPLYWKLSATLQEVREKNYDANTVRDGIAHLMHSAQKRVGWINDESDAGVNEQAMKKLAKKPAVKVEKLNRATVRKLAYL
ncbi:hypothetical protein KI387_028585 [Taxus chinensis]|uniref:Uncharacterized protein n=1 Tax=Taxus chinensis TaxID=29808 RepID=A0AA38FC30_TAXCH|nr:hypothetical protein KI387_028585 [Taxus chinensis]